MLDAEHASTERLKGEVTFDASRLDKIAGRILKPDGVRAVRLEEGSGSVSVVFVARHEDVAQVMKDEARFSVSHYGKLFAKIAPPGSYLYMREPGPERSQRSEILHKAAKQTPWFKDGSKELRAVSRACVDGLLAAFRGRDSAEFDIIGEYGYFAPYLIARSVLGLSGPRYWGPLEWLACQAKTFPHGRAFTPETGPYLTQLTWSQPTFAQLFGNFENRTRLVRWAAQYTTRRLRAHIRARLSLLASHLVDPVQPTLLSALLSKTVRDQFSALSDDEYEEHVISLMLELVGTAQLIPGKAFGGVIEQWAAEGDELDKSPLRDLTPLNLDAFLDEALRLAPPAPFFLRTATGDTQLSGFSIRRGEYVCALAGAAGLDWRAMSEAGYMRFDRDETIYLHFGPLGGPHRCFGRLVAHAMLGEMLVGLKQLVKLKRAGPMHRFLGNPERMMVRFDPRLAPQAAHETVTPGQTEWA